MNLFNLTEVGYTVAEHKVGARTVPARTIPSRKLCLNPDLIVSIEEPDEGDDHVQVHVMGTNVPYSVEGTFDEVVSIWAKAIGGPR